MVKSGLGRGLSSLIPQKIVPQSSGTTTVATAATARPVGATAHTVIDGERIMHIRTKEIVANPHQPRSVFVDENIKELQDSIKQHGILQPLTVSPTKKGYELIAGERRLRAALNLGLPTVPALVRKASDLEKLELALIENIQRQDLNAIEEAIAYRKLIDEFGLTQDQAAKKMGKSRSQIANRIRLLHLPQEIQAAVVNGELTEGHAKVILSLQGPEQQLAFFHKIRKQNLSVRDTETEIKKIQVSPHQRQIAVDPVLKAHIDALRKVLGTKVDIQKKTQGRGKLVIEFYSEEELQNIIHNIVE